MAADPAQENDNARRLNLARAHGQGTQPEGHSQTTPVSNPLGSARRVASGLSKLTPSGIGGMMGKKVAEKVLGRSRTGRTLGWVIGSVGCGCLVMIIFALLPILFIVVLGCGPLSLC